ncbi:hypothetical protein EJ02DRAFT_478620 [Clathrospora elynae]|uniref:RING-type domain-containing protein n=1 Tax=Clathrospora elynae TaxID=706981 RepID=A0A6A5T747_9PLEO|nr:hypothetical protein EJ02DRAFT_478620 [Clathrospora elynae]
MSTPTYTLEEFLSAYISATEIPTDDPECPICRDEYHTVNHHAVTFSDTATCNHVYGNSCLETWLSTERVNSCPMCRRELFSLPLREQREYSEEDDEEYFSGSYNYDDDSDDFEIDYESNFGFGYLRLEDAHVVMLDEEITSVLETVWYKIWNLLLRYRLETVSERDQYLPTNTLVMEKFLDGMASCFDDGDIEGLLGGYVLGRLDGVLGGILEEQKELIDGGNIEEGGEDQAMPFPGGYQGEIWREEVKRIMGIRALSNEEEAQGLLSG